MRQLLFAIVMFSWVGSLCFSQDPAPCDLEARLVQAGENRAELEVALKQAPQGQRADLEFLILHMPPSDLSSLSAEFLLEHLTYAHRAWASSPWKERISRDLFRNEILPYASINERRDSWRRDFHERFICRGVVAFDAIKAKGGERPGSLVHGEIDAQDPPQSIAG